MHIDEYELCMSASFTVKYVACLIANGNNYSFFFVSLIIIILHTNKKKHRVAAYIFFSINLCVFTLPTSIHYFVSLDNEIWSFCHQLKIQRVWGLLPVIYEINFHDFFICSSVLIDQISTFSQYTIFFGRMSTQQFFFK